MDSFFSRLGRILSYDPANPMLFNTGLFLVLFIIFMVIYQLVKGHRRTKMLLVLTFSLYFYYKASGWSVLLLCAVCASDYYLGLLLGSLLLDFERRAVVLLNVIINVGMLVYFKYFNLIADAFNSITGAQFDPLQVILPAGISFFTFRSISYIVDIYRGDMKPCRNFLNYAFYLTFFPPLLAGPVVRAKDMLPQVESDPDATPQMIAEGLFLIMTGLIKKVVIADYISGNFVDRIFDNPMLYSGFENLMGCIGFTVQLYCDFSGYSDMAIGLALLLGYRFADNFAAPFKSQSPTEFWRRWHISLSTWLRDYIYIPLGGNRRGTARAYLNQFTTMVIGGIWHGASWMYIIWGAYNGILLAAHKALRRVWKVPEPFRGRP
ncbi:MAG: MBOAT family protein, partial [Muribaculaceae bacterium]|nr:MBOAT family protein [Muribaculaceae bacterium]